MSGEGVMPNARPDRRYIVGEGGGEILGVPRSAGALTHSLSVSLPDGTVINWRSEVAPRPHPRTAEDGSSRDL